VISRVAHTVCATAWVAAVLAGGATAGAHAEGIGGVAAPATVSTPAAVTTTTSSVTTAPTAGATATGSPTTTIAAGRATTRRATSSLSTGAILAAVAGGLLLLAVLTWGVFRWGAFEPHWLLTLRHSLAEAGFRLSATAAELGDWARLGR
jgi:hypothetical protein